MCNDTNKSPEEFSIDLQEENNISINIERVQPKDLILLGVQFTVLEIFSSSLLLTCNDRGSFEDIIEREVMILGRLHEFSKPYNSIIYHLNSNCKNLELSYLDNYGKKLNLDTYTREIDKIKNLLSDSENQFRSVVSDKSIDLDSITDVQRRICIQVFEREHSRAKYWLSRMVVDTETLPRARLIFKNVSTASMPNQIPQSTPLNFSIIPINNLLYIQLGFSLEGSSLRDFLLLAFKLFHEYFSHFYACYNATDRIILHQKVDVKFKDGWLFHTIKHFCEVNTNDLFESVASVDNFTPITSLKYSNTEIMKWIQKYISDMRYRKRGNLSYVQEMDSGYSLAEKFLNFLIRNFKHENNGRQKAELLYYKFSWDLIQYPPSNYFSHGTFMLCLDVYLNHDSIILGVQLNNYLSQTENNELCINIENLWSIIKPLNPEFNEEELN